MTVLCYNILHCPKNTLRKYILPLDFDSWYITKKKISKTFFNKKIVFRCFLENSRHDPFSSHSPKEAQSVKCQRDFLTSVWFPFQCCITGLLDPFLTIALLVLLLNLAGRSDLNSDWVVPQIFYFVSMDFMLLGMLIAFNPYNPS